MRAVGLFVLTTIGLACLFILIIATLGLLNVI